MDLRGRAPSCPACTAGRYDYADGAPRIHGRPLRPRRRPAPRRRERASTCRPSPARLRAAGDVVANEHLVRFRANGAELVVFGDGRAIVKGVRDAAEARSSMRRYVGS